MFNENLRTCLDNVNQLVLIFLKLSLKEIKYFLNFMQSLHSLFSDISFVVSVLSYKLIFPFPSNEHSSDSFTCNEEVCMLHLLELLCFWFFNTSISSESFLLNYFYNDINVYNSFIWSQNFLPSILIYKIWDCMGIDNSSNIESWLVSELGRDSESKLIICW